MVKNNENRSDGKSHTWPPLTYVIIPTRPRPTPNISHHPYLSKTNTQRMPSSLPVRYQNPQYAVFPTHQAQYPTYAIIPTPIGS
jgi:hypothetical protein